MAFRDSIQNIISYFRKNTSDAFEQEMRREDMIEALKNFAPFAAAGIVVLLIGLAGYSYWSYRNDVELLKCELLYDEYVRDLKAERTTEAEKKYAKLVKAGKMDTLLKIEATTLEAKAFQEHRQSTKNSTQDQWQKLCNAYDALDAALFPKSRHRSALYQLNQFILAGAAIDHGVEDQKMQKEIKECIRVPGAFSGLAHALQIAHAIQSKTLTVNMLSAWQKAHRTWIIFACALSEKLSTPQDLLK